MNYWQAVLFGAVQGLTEFLPVSSSGHLLLLQKIFGVTFEGGNMLFGILLHTGTLIAVIVIYFKQIIDLIVRSHKKLLFLIVATVPAALIGVLLGDVIDEYFYSGAFLGVGFLITSAVLLFTEIYSKRIEKSYASASNDGNFIAQDEASTVERKPFGWKNALAMGFAQCVAVFPGISRSGSTIAGGIISRGEKGEVANFSFLMSLPMIAGSLLVEIYKTVKAGDMGSYASIAGPLILAIVVAFAFGMLAIKVMLRIIKKANYKWFSLYLLLLGVAVIVCNICEVL